MTSARSLQHLYRQHLRAGGLYVIDDWNADHLLADALDLVLADTGQPGHTELIDTLEQAAVAKPVPDARLLRLPLELVLARASSRDVIREVTVMNNWVVIRRGDEPVDPTSFRLADLMKDGGGSDLRIVLGSHP